MVAAGRLNVRPHGMCRSFGLEPMDDLDRNMANKTRPIRILHVAAGMTRGGLETWLMQTMRRIDHSRFHFDFCTATDQPCAYDREIRELGGRIIPCLWNRSLRRFHRVFGRVLQDGRYDVVHAHLYGFSGIVLRAAAKGGVEKRLAHLHTTGDGRPSTLPRRLYRKLMACLVRRHATGVLGCSRGAFDAFFGTGWERDPRMRVVYYGIDLDPFQPPADRLSVLAELALPAETPLMLHVGRFVEAKNHRLLVDIFHETRKLRAGIHLVLIGEGELLAQTRARVRQLDLEGCVHFLGVRSDVARWMKAADVMVMPSIREGLPVTMIEAAAAGLPLLITDMQGMREANEAGCSGRLLSVELPVFRWAQAVVEALDQPRPDSAESLDRVRSSPFTSEASARAMECLYEGCNGNEAH